MVEKLRRTSSIRARLAPRIDGIGVEDHHFIEERIDYGAQGGDEREGVDVIALLAETGEVCGDGVGRGAESQGFIGLDVGCRADFDVFLSGLAEDVLDAFEGGRDCGEVFGAADWR